ncbi:MAG: deoxyguanosinetriphosphate triphosphohydrolase [Alphaproteobacteria bacterium CG11_big_fil_rev_8_21_14_0_20_44_7]|nr:MAG: deoxyguanosinetriphosphate triphosphohydrolase [Alphaproteobacteria bacterium CG11_big_fil_rev_8_21_14_0_20_44_7]
MSAKSSIACDPKKSRGRLYQEESAYERDAFQRDRDRIIHSTAFRRLEYKTQVFVNHEGDHYRTRLTHSLEVSQIARSVCKSLGLNQELAEAIALAHDLGHTPFGHAGEDALKRVYADFDHNAQTLKILTKLEEKYADFDGLNLSWETLEGIAKHNGPNPNPPKDIAEFNKKFDLELDKYPSLEAQIASLSDDIAYVNHDIDDGLRAGLFAVEDILDLPLVGGTFAEMLSKYKVETPRIIHESLRRVISAMVKDLLETTAAGIEQNAVKSPDDVRNLGAPLAKFSDEMTENIKATKAWLMDNMYRHKTVNKMTDTAVKTVVELFTFFKSHPKKLPAEWQKKAAQNGVDEVVADYIAGMTDRFAIEEYGKIARK